ncbi:hypothetical protein ACFSL6_14455 [Paenibacillus thailandensis]|uniref:Heparinase n=1 Tax=Paenibacillus thailandensis TaxID=393250 RepID=A0ABW5QQH5_9BACL
MSYERLVSINDEWAAAESERQVTDPSSRYYGGVADSATGIPWPSHMNTPKVMAIWGAALVNPDSVYYRNGPLLERLELAAEFMLRFQHEDGTVSPGWTNYHSPPDTAFVVVGLTQLYRLLIGHPWEELNRTAASLRLFLERTVPAMLTGGCHTPNHRWVLTAALGSLYRLFGEEALKDRAAQWLAEGIDITPDGEWTERSNGIYNTVSNIMLCHSAATLDRPELYEPVRRNLKMMLYLVHPGGEVVTDYSGRQDFGQIYKMDEYYSAYKLMAKLDNDPVFEAMAAYIGEGMTHPGPLPNNALLGHLLHPDWRHQGEARPELLPDRYRIVINGTFDREALLNRMEGAGHHGRIFHSSLHTEAGAPVARIRDKGLSATVMTEAPSFFALRHNGVRLLGVQLASTFGPGTIKFQRLEQLESGYRLTAAAEKGYYGPIPAASGTSPWYLLPHQLRPLTHSQRLEVTVETVETAAGWDLRIRAASPEDVVTQIVFLFGEEVDISGGSWLPDSGDGKARIWRDQTIRCSCGDEWIELTGAFLQHYADGIRGAEVPANCQAVKVNLVTPIDATFTLRLSGRPGA